MMDRPTSRLARLSVRRLVWLLLFSCPPLTLAGSQPAPVPPSSEVRALWVLRTSVESPEAITRLVQAARTSGFNTLLVQARVRGDAYYQSSVEPRATSLQGQPDSFDPLQDVLSAAHQAGLRVHAWVNVNVVSSAVELPASRRHVVYRHPEWLMVPRSLARDMAGTEVGSPAYLGELARWTRTRLKDVEGLYLSPIEPAAAAYTASVIVDLVSRYQLDGLHLDYVRYPNDAFDYSREALAEFRADVANQLSPTERQQLDARGETDIFAYPDTFNERWQAFRRSRLTSLVMRIRSGVKKVRPDLLVSAAVIPDQVEASDRRFQDWQTWLESGLVDVICPMAYTPDPTVFAGQIAAVRLITPPQALWAGIGAYRLPAGDTVSNILTARKLGADGIALFSYDSLIDPAQHQLDYLSEVGRAAFGVGTGAPAASR